MGTNYGYFKQLELLIALLFFIFFAFPAYAEIYVCDGVYQTVPCSSDIIDTVLNQKKPAKDYPKSLPTNFKECLDMGGNQTDSPSGEICYFQAPPTLLQKCVESGGKHYEIGNTLHCSLEFTK